MKKTDENNFILEIYYKLSFYKDKYGEGFIEKIFMNKNAISMCWTAPQFMACNTKEGITGMFAGVPIEVYSDGKDIPEYYFGIR